MNLVDFRDEIKLKLTGGILEIELDDSTIDKIILSALREIQRYITSTCLITVPYKSCINLSNPADTGGTRIKVNSVSMVYRTEDLGTTTSGNNSSNDPMQVAQWQLISGMGNLINFQDAVYNYAAWNTLLQIRNTTSTDLAFRFDKSSDRLYINSSSGTPAKVTIEFVPKFEDVNQIKSDYWIDMLMKLAIALTKVTLGRVRSRYTQSNALWQGDGDTLLSEGTAELENLRDMMLNNSELYYPID